MRLFQKLVILVSIPVLLIWLVAFYSVRASSKSLLTTIEEASRSDARALMDEIDRMINSHLSNWRAYTRGEAVQIALAESNEKYLSMPDCEAYIDQLDDRWVKEAANDADGDVRDSSSLQNRLKRTRLSRDLRVLSNKLAELSDDNQKVYGEIFVTNKCGANIAMTSNTSDFRQNDERWWQEAWEKGSFVSDVHHDPSADIDSVDICVRIEDDEGNGIGVLKAVLNIKDLVTVVRKRSNAGSYKEVILIGSDTSIIESSSNRRVHNKDGRKITCELPETPDSDGTFVARDNDPETQEDTLFVYAYSRGDGRDFKGLGWCILIKSEASQVLAPVEILARDIVLIALSATLLALLVSGGLATLLSRRIGHIVDATHKISRGELGDRVDIKGSDEIANLANSFNAMTEKLEKSRAEQKHTNEQLLAATHKARAASRSKDEFLANMSHEIRTPMNAIIGMTEYVLESDLDEKQRRYLSIIMDSGESLMTIINEILDFSKIEAGKIELFPEPMNLAERLSNAVRIIADRAHSKGIELICDIDPTIPHSINADATRLQQIVVNLVGNAIKFTSEGEVILRATLDGAKNRRATITISVTDTGIGIPPEKMETIFDAFAQADGSTTREFGGTGLGLSISQKLVEMMGAKLEVTSESDTGSCFSFTIEVDVVEGQLVGRDSAELDPRVVQSLSNGRFLIVEDNDSFRGILEKTLCLMNAETVVAKNGDQAIALLRELDEADKDISVALIDLRMAGVDGVRVLEHLRNNRAFRRTRVIAMSAGEPPETLEKLDSLGVEYTLFKPVRGDEVRYAVNRVLRYDASQSGNKSSGDVVRELPTVRPLRVLLAEDGLANKVLATSLLEQADHEVVSAVNGRIAVDKFMESVSPSGKRFDLILMDVQMPELDGLAATVEIRNIEKATLVNDEDPIPIIALTARAMRGDQKACFDAGMNAYLSKPFRKADFQLAIANFFDGPTNSTPEPDSDGEDVKSPANGTQVEPVNNGTSQSDLEDPELESTRELVGDDDESIRQLVEAFLGEAPELMKEIRVAIAESDRAAVSQATHKLKSALKIFGLPRSSQEAQYLESNAQDLDEPELNDRFEKLVRQIMHTMKRLRALTAK